MNQRRRLDAWTNGFSLLAFGVLMAAFSFNHQREPWQARVPLEDAELLDLVLERGWVYDGEGGPGIRADVGIRGDRIVILGDLSARRAGRRIDVDGLAVAPGFIDIHSHALGLRPEESPLSQRPLAENYLRQGVTTVIGGQDGSSPLAVADFLARLEAEPPAVHFGLFVGHGSVRAEVLGLSARTPTSPELERMKALVAAGMKEGAFGLSTGLEYSPGAFAGTEELIELARVAANYSGLYITHLRDEGGRLLESIEEALRMGREAGVAVQITHHKVVGPGRWGLSRESLRLIEEARRQGIDVTSDVYPYTASSTGLSILLPRWSLEGGQPAFLKRLEDPGARRRIVTEVVEHLKEERGADLDSIVLASCVWAGAPAGKSLAGILRERGWPVELEHAADLVLELQERGGCQAVLHSMSEEDLVRILRHPTTMVASDGGIPSFGEGAPHPRNYGAFVRVLSHYFRQLELLKLEEAIHKMSGLPAARLGLEDRGRLRPGAVADVTVFDPETVRDHATFSDPHRYASGVRYVLVAGEMVLSEGEPTGARPGRALRKGDR